VFPRAALIVTGQGTKHKKSSVTDFLESACECSIVVESLLRGSQFLCLISLLDFFKSHSNIVFATVMEHIKTVCRASSL